MNLISFLVTEGWQQDDAQAPGQFRFSLLQRLMEGPAMGATIIIKSFGNSDNMTPRSPHESLRIRVALPGI